MYLCIYVNIYIYIYVRGWLFEFCILATSNIISGQVQTCNSVTHGNFIVLLHWEIRPASPGPNMPLSHIFQTLSQPYHNSPERLAIK